MPVDTDDIGKTLIPIRIKALGDKVVNYEDSWYDTKNRTSVSIKVSAVPSITMGLETTEWEYSPGTTPGSKMTLETNLNSIGLTASFVRAIDATGKSLTLPNDSFTLKSGELNAGSTNGVAVLNGVSKGSTNVSIAPNVDPKKLPIGDNYIYYDLVAGVI